MSDLLKLEINGHIAQITIANPPANTWTYDSLSELKSLVEALNINKAVYALVITGEVTNFSQLVLI
jgi:enoyl-CoA hydratase/carnithine racemase